MNDYLEIDGVDYLIRFNWNAIGRFQQVEGVDFAELDKIAGKNAKVLTSLIHCGLAEGARIEKRDLPFTVDDLGALIGPSDIAPILEVFYRQISSSVGAVKVKKK